jgi:hypothetical protein
MTTRDAVTPIANLIERPWPRDIAYPSATQRAVPAIARLRGPRVLDRPGTPRPPPYTENPSVFCRLRPLVLLMFFGAALSIQKTVVFSMD